MALPLPQIDIPDTTDYACEHAKIALHHPSACSRLEVATAFNVYMKGGILSRSPWLLPAWLSLLFSVAVIGGFVYYVWYTKKHRGGGASSSGGRVYYVDNCRFFLETLVISKHMISWYDSGKAGQNNYDVWYLTALTNWTESFHMAMFACCSGLLSKGYLTPNRAKRTIMRVIVPFILLNWLVFPIGHNIFSGKPPWDLKNYFPTPWVQQDIMWFLYSWLFWRVSTGVFLSTMPPHVMLVTSYLISWMAGYWFKENDPVFFADTSFAWLPMYCTGYVIPLRALDVLDKNWVRALGLAVTVLSLGLHLVFAYISDPVPGALRDGVGPDDIGHDQPFDYGLYFQPWMSAASRHFYFKDALQVRADEPDLYWLAWTQRVVMQFLVMWPTGLGLMVLVPHSQKYFTEWGSRTMYAYVGQVISVMAYSCILWWLFQSTQPFGAVDRPFGPLVLLIISPIVGLFTNISWACSYTHRWMQYIMEPTWIFAVFLDDDQLVELTAEKKTDRPKPPPPDPKQLLEEDSEDSEDDDESSSEEPLRPLWRRLF